MTTTIGSEPGMLEKVGFVLLCGAMVLLFIAMTQPAWRGQEMAQEFKDDCAKRGGVLLVHERMLGTSYECASRLDNK